MVFGLGVEIVSCKHLTDPHFMMYSATVDLSGQVDS